MPVPGSEIRAMTDEELAVVARWVNSEVRKRQKRFEEAKKRDVVHRIESLIRSAGMSWDDVHRMAS